MRIRTFIVFLILASFSLSSQPDTTQLLQWEEGLLQWHHFKDDPLPNTFQGSHFEYEFGYYPKKLKRNDTVIRYLKAFGGMNMNGSWIHPDAKNAFTLMYNQTLLNTVEYFKRKMQSNLNAFVAAGYITVQFRYRAQSLKTELHQIQRETEYGLDTTNTRFWFKKSIKRLEQTPKNLIPRGKLSNFGMGMHLGLGHTILSSELSKYYSNPTGLDIAFDFGYKKLQMLAATYLSFHNQNRDYLTENEWEIDSSQTSVIFDIGFYYPVVNTPKWKIFPTVGFGGMELGSSSGDIENLHSYGPEFGIITQYRLRKSMVLIPSYYGREFADSYLRFRVSAMPTNFRDNLNGWTYKLSLQYGFFARYYRPNIK